MSRLMLIDGNNLLLRATFAADRVPLQVDGVPTAALLIFVNLLSRHIREERPTHLVLCWDGGRSLLRTGIYPEYKAHRGDRGADPDERGPFSQAKEFCTLAGIHHVERTGWEADDLIACYWQSWRRAYPGEEVVIVSGDKDLLQMIDAKTVQVRPMTPPSPTDRWDVARVKEKYGVGPEHLAKAMALIGDVGDNVPGVRGLGPKKAAKLLAENGYVLEQALAARPEDIRLALLSYDLVNLRDMNYASRGLVLGTPPEFRPTSYGGALTLPLLGYLDRYALESIRGRLAAQALWHEIPPRESTADV